MLKGYRSPGTVETPVKSIRKHCLTCMAGNAAEVRRCHIKDCWLWPYRMGKRPIKGSDDPLQDPPSPGQAT